MDKELIEYSKEIKKRGLSKDHEKRLLSELEYSGVHDIAPRPLSHTLTNFYRFNDFLILQQDSPPLTPYTATLKSLDELLSRDKQREDDGFPRKIRVGRLIKPGKSGKEKIIVVPTTVEEKFIHDDIKIPSEDEESAGGAWEGEEGDIIGEQPVHEQENGAGTGPGEGEECPHEMESNAYDLGKILSEHLELPNLKDKGKKRFLSHYTYDMTDQNRGFGQFLDKKATLRKIVETNISLGKIPDIGNIDPTNFLISPKDKIYKILSREKEYESQAMVFFIRDYSGSMGGKPTQLVVGQHVLIYSWLLYQYEKRVETRFILHDTDATEVPDFYKYYNTRVAGGTKVFSAFRLVNEIVSKENLNRDYNIYIFYGTDGDDWDTEGKEAIPELKKMLDYSNRTGITIVEHSWASGGKTEVEKYISKSGLLEKHSELLRMDILKEKADEPRLIEGIKKLIS